MNKSLKEVQDTWEISCRDRSVRDSTKVETRSSMEAKVSVAKAAWPGVASELLGIKEWSEEVEKTEETGDKILKR